MFGKRSNSEETLESGEVIDDGGTGDWETLKRNGEEEEELSFVCAAAAEMESSVCLSASSILTRCL